MAVDWLMLLAMSVVTVISVGSLVPVVPVGSLVPVCLLYLLAHWCLRVCGCICCACWLTGAAVLQTLFVHSWQMLMQVLLQQHTTGLLV